jgi:cyclopropane-fatty-acyl-phospholipid synthase
MLDPTMSYSCALFERDGMSLEQASVAKLERVCEQLDLRPEDQVIEIGTGWGGFAVHAAATRGCHVTTTTISADQHAYAVARVREAGLEELVTVLRSDYRDLRGRYDKLVSIEMIEAVGWQQIGTFFARCSRLLHPHGAMLLQTIDLHDLTASYVPTLRRWRERFLEHAGELEPLGYDEPFRRLWTLYLSYCEAGFAERRICDVQLLLAKPRWVAPRANAGAVSTAVVATG